MSGTFGRRAALAGALGGALGGASLSGTHDAAAAPGALKNIRDVSRDAGGTTITLDLAAAPFPTAAAPYQDRTVIAFVPRHFRAGRDGRVPLVVHFHGHNTTAERAVTAHRLREQLADSRQDAILLAPQGPFMAPDSSAGKLEAPGGLARLVGEALGALSKRPIAAALGPAALPAGASPGTVCLSAHSGGYHAAACSARVGGLSVREIFLFDALYADVPAFETWVLAGKGRGARARHKLVSYFGGGTTEANSRALFTSLERAGVRCAFEPIEGVLSREQIVRAEAVFIRSALAHGAMTHELNELRDCLYASSLPRRLPTTWFEQVATARKLDRM